MLPKEKWVWMPHPAHFICADKCRFHLATWVGGFIVSTVGEYLPDSAVREISARVRGVSLEGRGDARERDYMDKLGFEEIGAGRKYETMVFKAEPREADSCCPFHVTDHGCLDDGCYNDPGEAYRGHLSLCEKWSQIDEALEVGR